MIRLLRIWLMLATVVVVFVITVYYFQLLEHVKPTIKFEFNSINITVSRPAYRVCKPGPSLGYPEPESKLKNCLVIGDSISHWYTPELGGLLSKVCRLQRSPMDSRCGGARDSRYGRHCLPMLLRSPTGNVSFYDVIVFNFGGHDVAAFQRDAYRKIPFSEYISNLAVIKEHLSLTGANLLFLTTTPSTHNSSINQHIARFNRGAVEAFSKTPEVMVFDLYQAIVDHCRGNTSAILGKCGIYGGDYTHFNGAGSELIASHIAKVVKNILNTTKSSRFLPQLPGVAPDWISCPGRQFVVRCPPGSSCMKMRCADVGVGCCHIPEYVDCGNQDNYCDPGWVCDPKCTTAKCFCQKNITKTSYF